MLRGALGARGVMEHLLAPQWKFLTATQWLKANPDAHAIIGTRTHWLHVRNGKVVEDNGTWRPRARVEIRIPLGHMQIVEAMWKEMRDDLLVARAEMLVVRRRMERLWHLLETYKNEPDCWTDMLRELTAVHTG